MANWLLNEGPKWIFLSIWMIINVGLFVYHFLYYLTAPGYFYMLRLVGYGLPFARATAACLNFNCALILIPVCRNLISFVRGSGRCCKRNVLRLLDKNITFHKVVAYMICINTAIHTVAHCFNAEYFSMAYQWSGNNSEVDLVSAISMLPTAANETYINPIRTANSDPVLEVVKLIAGVTGVVATLVLIIIVSSSTIVIRRSYFEVFWYTHHLFIIFYIAVFLHGIQGIIRIQSNLDVHDPKKCNMKYKSWAPGTECDIPQFTNAGPQTWKWIIGPVFLYFVERCLRLWRSLQTVEIVKVVEHPSNVVELQMKKAGFKMESGQYIFIKCPNVSHFEWHPFTLTSATQEEIFSVHIRIVGDWTSALAKALKSPEGKEFQKAWKIPRIAVDGPFGTASEDCFRYEVGVFVGAGIGVTPFASILKDIWYKCNDPNCEMKLKKVYLYWICPDTKAFEWFADLLTNLENQMAEKGQRDFLDYNIYLTRGWDTTQARNILLHEQDDTDVITGLKQKTSYGRPNWDMIFCNLGNNHPNISVGVFCCGPAAISKQLHKRCNQFTSTAGNGSRFFFNKENF